MRLPFTRSLKAYIVGSQAAAYSKREGWIFSADRAFMMQSELSTWLNEYCPIDLRGKVVLDVGAGEGETAKFFLQKGAKEVIAIESDPQCWGNLFKNADRFPIFPIYRKFEAIDLILSHVDFAKIDIEGYEETILGTRPRFPCAVEVHGLQLRDRFKAQGWRVTDVKPCYCTCMAYWKC